MPGSATLKAQHRPAAVSWTWTDFSRVEEYILPGGQRGIRARTPIARGQVIGVYGGQVVLYKLDAAGRITDPDAATQAIQVATGDGIVYALVTPPGVKPSGIDLINHSCQPNIQVASQIVLLAGRDITAGEPLTADYTTWDYVPYGQWCWCPQPRCLI